MSTPRFTALAAGLPATVPFVGPETLERTKGATFRARLGANESGFGPSPRAIQAMANAAQEAWMYGDPESFDLRSALAAHHGIGFENVMVGEGIDGLLGYLVRLCVAPGNAVVTSLGAYPTFNYHVAGFGGALHTVPYRDDREDLPGLLAKAAEVDAKLVYFANPDNPMGTWWTGAEIAALLDEVPDGCLLVLDEAYADLAPSDALADISVEDPRVIRMRTFSKGYGMAGARVGYAMGAAETIAAFNKVRNHFGMSRLSQAGALAALADQEYLDTVRQRVVVSRARITQIAGDCGLATVPSATNFVTVDCGADGVFAQTVLDALVADGVFVRKPFVPPQDRCIRIGCGPEADMDILAEALPKALAMAQQQSKIRD